MEPAGGARGNVGLRAPQCHVLGRYALGGGGEGEGEGLAEGLALGLGGAEGVGDGEGLALWPDGPMYGMDVPFNQPLLNSMPTSCALAQGGRQGAAALHCPMKCPPTEAPDTWSPKLP